MFRWTVRICSATCVILIASALWLWGAMEVRGHFETVLPLTFVGVIWLVISQQLFSWFGVSVRDDAVERKNPAALVALCGATVAVAIIYAAGNLGEGPSYLENVFSSGLGTLGFFGLWLLLELVWNVSNSIVEERDPASGLRLGAYLLATGLIFGRAVAGDWHSEIATVRDFMRDGWPAIPLWFMALIFETMLRPSRHRPFPAWRRCGLLPSMLYLGIAVVWVCVLGRWEGMPR